MCAPWAVEEATGANFGDKRLNDRMAVVLSDLGTRPNVSIPAACKGRSEMHAAYRFFANKSVTFEKVLEPHVQRTLQRMSGQETALLIQDTTEIDLSRPNSVVCGVGNLDGVRRGILLHEMQAFTPDGTPLGTVWAHCINRAEPTSDASSREKKRRRKFKPIEQKESMRWLSGIRRAREIAAELPQVHCIAIADSEGDIYECLAEPSLEAKPGQFDWIVRGCHDRALDDETEKHLRQTLLGTPVVYKKQIQVRPRKAKIDNGKRARRKLRGKRKAWVEVRAATVTLRAPSRKDRKLPPVTVNAVLVREIDPPAGEEPLEWLLLTSLPIKAKNQVKTIVGYYCKRWGIEVFFKTLKSGCRVEERRFEDVERVLPSLAMYLIVAWRTLFICHMSREYPQADCELVLEPSEWKAVWTAIHQTKPPRQKPDLKTMIHNIASLGGYVESPKREPGAKTLWIGLQRMGDLAWAWDTFGPGARNGEGIV